MALRSLRSYLFVGSLLWTVGVLAIAAAVATSVVRHFPHWASVAHNVMLMSLAAALGVAGLAQVRRGLSPLNQLRVKLGAVRRGQARQVDGPYPSEVQPLVNDLNALLEDREQRLTRALAQAGNLAHGLKTPLAVLAQEAARAEDAGHMEWAAAVAEQVERMRRQMDYHLAQARAAVSLSTPGARCDVAESANGLGRTLLRLHASRDLRIDVRVAPGLAVAVAREIVDEMLGNLLDNACTWARSAITVSAATEASALTLTVDDDGPGIAPEMLEAVLQRGVRADDVSTGSGFGLAIVRDLAELHGGSIALSQGPGDIGVRARLTLPCASSTGQEN